MSIDGGNFPIQDGLDGGGILRDLTAVNTNSPHGIDSQTYAETHPRNYSGEPHMQVFVFPLSLTTFTSEKSPDRKSNTLRNLSTQWETINENFYNFLIKNGAKPEFSISQKHGHTGCETTIFDDPREFSKRTGNDIAIIVPASAGVINGVSASPLGESAILINGNEMVIQKNSCASLVGWVPEQVFSWLGTSKEKFLNFAKRQEPCIAPETTIMLRP
ncbi:MAG: hypothetical protein DHS20C02_06720 [Micavibrio sp.]|nr:MAG: hypothetical protein DHS20C02_06720 [Micavibrio sp.]